MKISCCKDCPGRVYHYGYDEKHREKGKKKYLEKTEDTNENRTGNYGGERLFGEH